MKNLIINYVNTMSINDIKTYSLKKGYNLSNEELIIIYDFIKKYYLIILDGNESPFKELKYKLKPNLYNTIYSLYMENKIKYFK